MSGQEPPQHGGELELERAGDPSLAAFVLRERCVQLTERDAVGDRERGVRESRPMAARIVQYPSVNVSQTEHTPPASDASGLIRKFVYGVESSATVPGDVG